MTALEQYQRLEATGLWQDGPDVPLRDVIVSFGDATLILSDPRTDTPLAHWSLPAVTRLNPGDHPARYAPGEMDVEWLEVEDELMISAIDKVHRAIEASKPPSGRLRNVLMLTAAAASLALIPIARQVFWGPMAYAMMGGIIAGTLITLLFVPALYCVVFGVRPERRGSPAAPAAGRPVH